MLSVKVEKDLGRYHQGSGIADMLICKQCGVMIGASFRDRDHLYAAINYKTIGQADEFAQETVTSPRTLNDEDKKLRWKNIWFSNVASNLENL